MEHFGGARKPKENLGGENLVGWKSGAAEGYEADRDNVLDFWSHVHENMMKDIAELKKRIAAAEEESVLFDQGYEERTNKFGSNPDMGARMTAVELENETKNAFKEKINQLNVELAALKEREKELQKNAGKIKPTDETTFE